jgi:uncharacterized protein YwgA
MDRLQRAVVITRLAQRLRECGSWCGETHIQKSVYLMQELFDTGLKYNFILYHHGPYSFDLTNELTALRADGFLEIEPQEPPFGPKLKVSTRATSLHKFFKKTLGRYEKFIEFIASKLCGKGVKDLEKIATALYVDKQLPNEKNKRIDLFLKLKPHITKDQAKDALSEIEETVLAARSAIAVA